MPTSITRRNPRTGRIERPWRNRDGHFVLGDPAHGAQKHHDRFAVKVATIEEVVDLVRQGFSLRMTDGDSAPSLIAPASLELEELPDADPAPLFAETAPKPSVQKQAMLAELKRALLVQANQIAHAGSLDYAVAFMGFETGDASRPYCEDDPEKVDLDRFRATYLFGCAYDYAFQVGSLWSFSADDLAEDLVELVRGANMQASNGEMSPLSDPGSACRQVADMAYARWCLKEGDNLSVRQLALLAQMSEAAARNALSKERITIEAGHVDPETAVIWLRQRREFIPTRNEEAKREHWLAYTRGALDHDAFDIAMTGILHERKLGRDDLVARIGGDATFVDALLGGRPVPDLEKLRQVGELLELDAPHFVGTAVRAALQAMA